MHYEDKQKNQASKKEILKRNWKKYLIYAAVASIIIALLYLETRYCGNLAKPMNEIPAWCWWLK